MKISVLPHMNHCVCSSGDVAGGIIQQVTEGMGCANNEVFQVSYNGTVVVQRRVPSALPTPQITQAQCNILDLASFTGDATLTVAHWPSIKVGQWVWLFAVGVMSDGRALTITLSDGAPVTETDLRDGFSRQVPRAELDKLAIGSTLRLELKVSFDPCSCCASDEAFRFPEGSVVLALYRELTDFDDGTFNGWTAGPAAPTDTTYFKIVTSGTERFLYNGTPGGTVAGIILFKEFSRLKAGAHYVFSLQFKSTNTFTNTDLYLNVVGAGGRIAEPIPITQNWQTLAGSFVAPSEAVVLQIGNDSAAGTGNDYYIDNIEVSYADPCE